MKAAPDSTPRRRRARRGEGDRLREEILAAATALLLEHGDEDAVAIRAVADAVGVTTPSIYRHFADKTDLFFAVCEVHFALFAQEMAVACAGITDPIERLRARGRAYIAFGLRQPEHYRILFMHKPHEAPARVDMQQVLTDGGFGDLMEDVQAAIAGGQLRGDDPLVAAMALWAGAHGLTSLLISHPKLGWPPQEQLVSELLDALLRGLAARAHVAEGGSASG